MYYDELAEQGLLGDSEEAAEEYWEQHQREREEADPWVLDCGNPDCLMPGYHHLSECMTVADYENYYAEMKAAPETKTHGA